MKLNGIQFNNQYNLAFVALKPKEPISYAQKNLNGLVCDTVSFTRKKDSKYTDPALFSEYFEEKLKNELCIKEEKDIQNIVSSVAEKTGLKEEKVCEIVSRLTQFSSYSQLKNLGNEFVKDGVGLFPSPNLKNITLNDVFNYLEKKHQIDLSCAGRKSVYVLDKNLIEILKNDFEQNGREHVIKNYIEEHGVSKFYVIDGWEAKVDGEDVSQSLFGSPLSLEESTEKIAQKMQNDGASLDEILNGDIIKEAKAILGENIEIEIIKNPDARKKTPKEISERMQPVYPSKEKIKEVIETIVDKKNTDKEHPLKDREKEISALTKYFDKMAVIFSSHSMTKALKDKYKQIEEYAEKIGKTMDDVVYIVPRLDKSNALITYTYMKTNNINSKKILLHDGVENNSRYNKDKRPPLNGKICVILDDIVGSGYSMTEQVFSYDNFSIHPNTKNANLVFAPLTSLNRGKKHIIRSIFFHNRKTKDVFLEGENKNYGSLKRSLSPKEWAYLPWLIGGENNAYGNGCILMPYMIPDNDTKAAGLLFGECINGTSANKASDWHWKYCKHPKITE